MKWLYDSFRTPHISIFRLHIDGQSRVASTVLYSPPPPPSVLNLSRGRGEWKEETECLIQVQKGAFLECFKLYLLSIAAGGEKKQTPISDVIVQCFVVVVVCFNNFDFFPPFLNTAPGKFKLWTIPYFGCPK